MKFKRMIIATSILSTCMALTSCSFNLPTTIVDKNEDITPIYDLYVSNGGTLSYDEWLTSIKGEKGDKGDTGANGLSAYEIYVKYHPEYTGSEEEWINSLAKGEFKDTETSANEILENVIYDDFQIHFMMLGNANAGDSIYIKAGDNDILIDAGSKSSSATTIENYIDQYCTDKKLEYVIATHGDSDHISAFPSIFSYYDVDTTIDFTYTTKTTATYNKYLTARDTYSKNHFTSKDCFYEENGGQRVYSLGTDKNGVEMNFEIIYNYYYTTPATDENNNSVVTMFNYGKHHYLLSGDLEKEGEEKLAEYYDGSTKDKTLPEVDLFKAGHHGSKTSSNDCLLSLIKPKMCVVSCCAGTIEYTVNRVNTFPTQDFINRIAKYTDRVYITSMWNENANSFEAMNGNVVVSSNGKNVGLKGSNNVTKLKDTTWFSHKVYVDSKDKIVSNDTEGATKVPCRTMPEEWK